MRCNCYPSGASYLRLAFRWQRRGLKDLPQFEPTNVAWDDSILTVTNFPDVLGPVYRFQTREGLRNEKQDSKDSIDNRHSRADHQPVAVATMSAKM